MAEEKVLKACWRCSSPFLKRCPEPLVVRCEACNYMHVLRDGFDVAEAPVGAVTIIRDQSDRFPGLVLVTRMTRSVICERYAQRKDVERLAPDAIEAEAVA